MVSMAVRLEFVSEIVKVPLGGLTNKQIDVLNLLIENKTSKEISRILGISPHTVDQRISFAKEKLHANNRGELAQAYRKLAAIYEQLTYEDSYMAAPAIPLDAGDRNDPEQLLVLTHPERSIRNDPENTHQDYRVPELFDGPSGTLIRLAAIAGITVLLILIALGGIAMFSQASQLVFG